MDFRPDVAAGKYDPALFDSAGQTLLVNEIFYTVQGEGLNAGRAAVFIRLAKCNLACKFCDTEFETFRHMHVTDVVGMVEALAPPLVGLPNHGERPLVVLTGGEPGIQNCGPLVDMLQGKLFNVCLETSGSVYADWMANCAHICISPKVPLAKIPAKLLAEANEVKWIVNTVFLLQQQKAPVEFYALGPANFLQPESQNPKWTAAAVKLVQRYPWRYRLSVQTHKYIGVP